MVRVDDVISVLKTAAVERKLGTFIVDPLSVTLQEENATLSSPISPTSTKSTPTNTSSGARLLTLFIRLICLY